MTSNVRFGSKALAAYARRARNNAALIASLSTCESKIDAGITASDARKDSPFQGGPDNRPATTQNICPSRLIHRRTTTAPRTKISQAAILRKLTRERNFYL